jgi:hypothetical protein
MAAKKTTVIALIATPMAGLLVSCAATKSLVTRATDEELAVPALNVLHRNYKMKDLTGDELGADGGMLIAAVPEKFDQHKTQEAVQASQRAEQSPMRVADVHNAMTADLNGDGYVTLDEVIAMQRAGLSDYEIVNRLRATPQIFSLTAQQEHYLTDRHVSKDVVNALRDLQKLNEPLAVPGA